MKSWNYYKCNPSALQLGGCHGFDQNEDFKAMEANELTKEGCCMAMTVRFFDHYVKGVKPGDFVNWLKGTDAQKDIIDLHTAYKTNSNTGATTLKALVRMVEDDIFKAHGYTKVEHMVFPTIRFTNLEGDTVKLYSEKPLVFKPIYFAKLSTGKSHAMGIILDQKAGNYYFFDPNEGIATFKELNDMGQWVEKVKAVYDEEWSAYF